MSDKAKHENRQRSRIALFGLCSLLALVLCIGVVIGVAISMITEGVYDFGETDYQSSLTPMPKTEEGCVKYLSDMLGKATDDKRVYVNSAVTVSVDEESIIFSGTKYERTALMYMKDKIFSSIDEIYPENYEGKFGDGFRDYPLLSLESGEYAKAVCTEGATDDLGEPIDEDSYFVNVTLPGGVFPAKKGSGVYETYKLQDSEAIANEIKKDVESYITVDTVSILPNEFSIEAKVNRLKDEITYADFIRTYKISLGITFTGDYAALGSRTLCFEYKISERYDYTWAGLSFEETDVSIEAGSSQPLPLKAVMNDSEDYTVTFESSNEKVATVDELGYVYGIANSKEPIKITARLKYLGQEYVAECIVHVTVPVKKIKISQDKMALAVSETGSLSAKLEPKNATITDVIWKSTDESVATVSEDGTVTALKAGKTTIIAIAADGYFRDSCAVTVTN